LARHQAKTAPRGRTLVKYAVGVKLLGQPLVQRLTQILAGFPEVKTIVVEGNQGGSYWKDILKDVLTADGQPVKVQIRWSRIGKGAKGTKLDKPDKFATALDYWQRGFVLHRDKFPQLIGQAVAFDGRSKTHDDVIDAAVQGVLFFLAPSRRVRVQARESSYLSGVA
jgi:phage terminase large subunit-like protein